MAKIFISDLSKVLIEKHGVSESTAKLFLTSIVECLQDGIADDNFVKVKGLGTFKLIGVDARESVDVNSGERVVIDSHQKISFLPENSMKELVNRPFSQFETVVLNDGVDAETLARAAEIAAQQENLDPDLSEELEESVADNDEDEEVVVASPVEEQATAASQVADEAPAKIVEVVGDTMEGTVPYSGDEDYFKDEQPMKEKNNNYWWAWLILAVAACVASFAGGYIFGTEKKHAIEEVEAVVLPETEPETTDSVTSVTEEPKKAKESKEAQKAQEPQSPQQPKSESQKPQEPQKAQEPQKPQSSQPSASSDWQKYDNMDARLRSGAYGIVGTDRVVTVKEGQTLTSISNSILGPGMECYIEVYNGLKASDKLKAGQQVKIPKVELKKKLKKIKE